MCQKVGMKCCGQKQHFVYHRQYCSVIDDLESLELCKLYKDFSVREEQVDVKTKTKLMELIGMRPHAEMFFLDEETCEVLWDTGSMVSLVDTNWIKTTFS